MDRGVAPEATPIRNTVISCENSNICVWSLQTFPKIYLASDWRKFFFSLSIFSFATMLIFWTIDQYFDDVIISYDVITILFWKKIVTKFQKCVSATIQPSFTIRWSIQYCIFRILCLCISMTSSLIMSSYWHHFEYFWKKFFMKL